MRLVGIQIDQNVNQNSLPTGHASLWGVNDLLARSHAWSVKRW